jgi:signal recognition particle subunit SEC65
MSLFKEFTILFPYLQTVRKLKTYLSFDIEFPESWKLPKKYVNEEKIVENEKSKQGYRFFSFVSEFDEKLVDEIISNIKNIIAYNKEREEKERLFQLKVDELKKMFRNKNVKELFKDRFVFFSAMQKLTFYKFRHQARKIIFSYFDTFM